MLNKVLPISLRLPHIAARLFLGAMLAGAAQADDHLKLVTGGDYPPFADSSDPTGGRAVELVRTVLARAGYEMSLDWMPWRRGYAMTLAGAYDATFPYVPSEQRRAEYRFSQPLFKMEMHAYMMPRRELRDGRPSSLRGKVLCLPNGWNTAPILEGLLRTGGLRREQPNDLAACARMVRAGRADFFVADSVVYAGLMKQLGIPAQSFVGSDKPLAESALYFIVPKRHPDSERIIARFNAALQDVLAEQRTP
jgi:polar amino acid transport system substrate-binding protein